MDKHADKIYLFRIGKLDNIIRATSERTIYGIVSKDCETITVLVTICADGSAISPLVIFQGQTFFCKWGIDNPLNCM